MMNICRKINSIIIVLAFLLMQVASACPLKVAFAQTVGLPPVGSVVSLSAAFAPAVIKGLTINADNPFQMNFIVDVGEDQLSGALLEKESTQLIKYFLTALTTPEDELWVNLSPYEQNRIIPKALGQTEMGRDMLAQDYILKQLTASLMIPENEYGAKFWETIYARAFEEYGVTDIPLNTFNKVWIVPQKAVVYVQGNNAFVVDHYLKVMLEEDYLALENSSINAIVDEKQQPKIVNEIIRQVIIPELEKEVNNGKTFVKLRQIFHSLILATWFKNNLKEHVLGQVYVDQNKVHGLELIDQTAHQKIYDQYIAAFKKGVCNYIKEDYDPQTQQIVERKYFSGGVVGKLEVESRDYAMPADALGDEKNLRIIKTDFTLANGDAVLEQPVDQALLTQEQEELTQFIGEEVGAKRLVWSEDSNAVDYHLRQVAKEKGVEYLRVTLRDQEDLDRLLSDIEVHDGDIVKKPGKLFRLLGQESILFIDYTNSNPKFVEQLNSIFDDDPYFKGQPVDEKVTVVGNIKDAQLKNHPVSFYSRFGGHKDMKVHALDPIANIEILPEDADALHMSIPEVNLFDQSSSREIYGDLIGSHNIDSDGNVVATEGALLSAIKANVPLVIQGGRFEDPYLKHLLRQVLLDGEISFNGETVKIRDNFKILKQEVDPTDGLFSLSIVSPWEAKSDGELWVINSQNQDILWSHTKVNEENLLVEAQGITSLKREKAIRIRITDNLEDWVWKKMINGQAEFEIEVEAGVYIPSFLQGYVSEGLKKFEEKKKPQLFEENSEALTKEKVVIIESNDLTYAQAVITEVYGEDSLAYPVTSETSTQELVQAIDMEIISSTEKRFYSRTQQVIKELRAGKTVVLEGVDVNESLYRELETAFSQDPYIYSNGERISLNELPGRLIVTLKTGSNLSVQAKNHASIEVSAEKYKEQLKKEFGEDFKEEDYKNVEKIYQIFESIPAPTPGLYPENVLFNLSRLRLLFDFAREGNWLSAFEDVLVSSYADAPQVASFIRVMVRVIFNVDYEDQKLHSIHGKKLKAALNELPQGVDWQTRFWELSDSLSLDLLKSSLSGSNAGNTSTDARFNDFEFHQIFQHIEQALIKNSINAKEDAQDLEEMYRLLFNNQEDVSAAPLIDDSLSDIDLTWQELRDQIIHILSIKRGIMLKGSPGTGKSFITNQIATELNYRSDQIYGPLTTGTDTKEADVISETKLIDQKTGVVHKELAQWALNEEGGILIVDEANLPHDSFWNFLKGAFNEKPFVWIDGKRIELTDRHIVVFTGNQETLEDRHYMDIIENDLITVAFSKFTKSFIKERVNHYVRGKRNNREALVEQIVDLHFFFQDMNKDIEFSLRDVQELSDRVNIFLDADWELSQVVEIAWDIYKGNFSKEEQKAFQYLLLEKYGVEVETIQEEKNKKIRKEWGKQFTRQNGQDVELSLVDSSAEMVASILDFLKVRDERIAGRTGIQGKRGLLYEGFSGRGKDAAVLKTLKLNGFVDGANGGKNAEGVKKFYRLTGSLDTDEMVERIMHAREEGALVIISEANLLSSGFLEGKLNDLLTGNAHQGFGIVITINSVDFGGREKFSSALQNRLIYKRIDDYTETEFKQIGADMSSTPSLTKSISKSDLNYLVKAHVWIKDQIEDQRYHPTTREFRRVLKKVQEENMSIEAAITQVYGDLFLNKVLGGVSLPNRSFLINEYQVNPRLNMELVQEFMINFVMPKAYGHVEIRHDASDSNQAGGYIQKGRDGEPTTITYHSRGFETEEWVDTTFHEAAHSKNGRTFPGGGSSIGNDAFDDLVQDMGDLLDMNSFANNYGNTTVNSQTEDDVMFADMVAAMDDQFMDRWMAQTHNKLTHRKIFQLALFAYEKNLISKEQLQEFSDFVSPFFDEVNPFEAGLSHLNTAKMIGTLTPNSSDEQSILLSNFKVKKLVDTMKEDFLSIENPQEDKEEITEEQEQDELERGKNILNNTDWKVRNRNKKIERRVGKKLTKEEVDARKQERVNRKEERLKATKQDIELLLSVMRNHLNHPFGVTLERLSEMKRELTDHQFIYSYSKRIEALNDIYINAQVELILREIDSWLNRKAEKEVKKKETVFDKLMKKFGNFGLRGFGRGLGTSEMGSPIGVVHGADSGATGMMGQSSGGFGAHGKGSSKKYKPQRISPPKVERSDEVLASTETVERDINLKTITNVLGEKLMRRLDFLHHTKLEADKVWGTRGKLDVSRFIENPLTAFASSGGVAKKVKKEIVLKGDISKIQWNPILEEVFLFLLNNDFRVTVYQDAFTYTDNIKTLSDLKRIVKSASDVAITDIKKDLLKRKSETEVEFVDVNELQQKVEQLYVYGAFKKAAQGQVEKEKKSTDSKADSQALKQMPVQEQIQKIYSIMRNNGLKTEFSKGMPTGVSLNNTGGIKVDLSKLRNGHTVTQQQLVDFFDDVSVFDQLTSVDAGDQPISNLNYLVSLPYLEEVTTLQTDITNDQAVELFSNQRNAVNLKIVAKGDVEFFLTKEGGTLDSYVVHHVRAGHDSQIDRVTVPITDVSEIKKMTATQQAETINKIFARHKIVSKVQTVNIARMVSVKSGEAVTIELKLAEDQELITQQQLESVFKELSAFDKIEGLSLGNHQNSNLEFLNQISNLSDLSLQDLGISDGEIIEPFSDHSNAVNLSIYGDNHSRYHLQRDSQGGGWFDVMKVENTLTQSIKRIQPKVQKLSIVEQQQAIKDLGQKYGLGDLVVMGGADSIVLRLGDSNGGLSSTIVFDQLITELERFPELKGIILDEDIGEDIYELNRLKNLNLIEFKYPISNNKFSRLFVDHQNRESLQIMTSEYGERIYTCKKDPDGTFRILREHGQEVGRFDVSRSKFESTTYALDEMLQDMVVWRKKMSKGQTLFSQFNSSRDKLTIEVPVNFDIWILEDVISMVNDTPTIKTLVIELEPGHSGLLEATKKIIDQRPNTKELDKVAKKLKSMTIKYDSTFGAPMGKDPVDMSEIERKDAIRDIVDAWQMVMQKVDRWNVTFSKSGFFSVVIDAGVKENLIEKKHRDVLFEELKKIANETGYGFEIVNAGGLTWYSHTNNAGGAQGPAVKNVLTFDEQVDEAKRIVEKEYGLKASAVGWAGVAKTISIDLKDAKGDIDLNLLNDITHLNVIRVFDDASNKTMDQFSSIVTAYEGAVVPLKKMMNFMSGHSNSEKIEMNIQTPYGDYQFKHSDLIEQIATDVLKTRGKASTTINGGLSIVVDQIDDVEFLQIIDEFKSFGINAINVIDLQFSNVNKLAALEGIESIEEMTINNRTPRPAVADFFTQDIDGRFDTVVKNSSEIYSLVLALSGDVYRMEFSDLVTNKNLGVIELVSNGNEKQGDATEEIGVAFLQKIVDALVDKKVALSDVKSKFIQEGRMEEFDGLFKQLSIDSGLKEEIIKQKDQPSFISVSNKGSTGVQGSNGEKKKGGIDFNPELMSFDVVGGEIRLNPSLNALSIQLDGLIPVIVEVLPIGSLQSYLSR